MSSRMNTELDKIEIPKEIDEPLEDTDSFSLLLERSKVNEIESHVNAVKNLYILKLKEEAFKLILISLFVIICILVLDTVLINLKLQLSSFATNIFELFKYIVTILLGFLFASQTNKEQ